MNCRGWQWCGFRGKDQWFWFQWLSTGWNYRVEGNQGDSFKSAGVAPGRGRVVLFSQHTAEVWKSSWLFTAGLLIWLNEVHWTSWSNSCSSDTSLLYNNIWALQGLILDLWFWRKEMFDHFITDFKYYELLKWSLNCVNHGLNFFLRPSRSFVTRRGTKYKIIGWEKTHVDHEKNTVPNIQPFLISIWHKWETGAVIYWNVQIEMETKYLRQNQSLYDFKELLSQYLLWAPLFINTVWTHIDKLSCPLFK